MIAPRNRDAAGGAPAGRAGRESGASASPQARRLPCSSSSIPRKRSRPRRIRERTVFTGTSSRAEMSRGGSPS